MRDNQSIATTCDRDNDDEDEDKQARTRHPTDGELAVCRQGRGSDFEVEDGTVVLSLKRLAGDDGRSLLATPCRSRQGRTT